MSVRDTQRMGRRVLQSSVPFYPASEDSDVRRAKGLLLTGVVTATYTMDDPAHPLVNDGTRSIADPIEVFCDVLIYSNIPRLRMKFLPMVRVSQPRGGMHDGEIWKPRATTYNIADAQAFATDSSGNPKAIIPANLDGDHVIIGFLNDHMDEPIILRYVKHPSTDEGNLDNPKGLRKRLKSVDGDPYFIKHHGVYFGVDDNGDYLVDTIGSHSGIVDPNGLEPVQDNTKGSQTYQLPLAATHKIVFSDGQGDRTKPPIEKIRITTTQTEQTIEFIDSGVTFISSPTKYEVKLGGMTLLAQGKDATATLKIGDGSAHAALWEDLKAYLNNFITNEYNTHLHPTGTGPSGVPATPGTAPTNTDGQSDKITIPVN